MRGLSVKTKAQLIDFGEISPHHISDQGAIDAMWDCDNLPEWDIDPSNKFNFNLSTNDRFPPVSDGIWLVWSYHVGVWLSIRPMTCEEMRRLNGDAGWMRTLNCICALEDRGMIEWSDFITLSLTEKGIEWASRVI